MTAYMRRLHDPKEADKLLNQLRREQERRPRRELSTYRIVEPGRDARSVMICRPCLHTLEEPARATRTGDAAHARSCDWCGCRNAQPETKH